MQNTNTTNLYEVPEVVEAGNAHELIQSIIIDDGPGKNHKFVFECDTCTNMAWTLDAFLS